MTRLFSSLLALCLPLSATPPADDFFQVETVAGGFVDAPGASENLANKVLNGGVGVWGEQPVPPHPQHHLKETRQMVEAILKVK